MEKKELIEEMVELQRRVDRDRRQYELDAWMHLHLGIGQLKALFFISNRGSTTTGKLAIALKVTPTNVTGIIDRLLEKKLITRTGDPDDRRVLLLRTTTLGDELVTELRQKRRERMTELFTRLSEEEAAIVSQGLKIMVKAIDAKPDEAEK
jgi:MarR family transcriptional regulator, organic hydroperoxide resistance regulator